MAMDGAALDTPRVSYTVISYGTWDLNLEPWFHTGVFGVQRTNH